MNVYPAMKFKFGNWEAYQIVMRVGELRGNIEFAQDVFEETTLDEARQRAIDQSRAKNSIATYLVRPDNERFFNSLVIAVEGGDPRWIPAPIDNDRQDIFDDNFSDVYGAIKFSGNQSYFALDGQHRMAAIEHVLKHEDFSDLKPRGFENDQVSLILVVQPEAMEREEFTRAYRRLFGHLNRYARKTTKVSDIIMDEDDVFAILTRRLVSEHEFFKSQRDFDLNTDIERVKTNQKGSSSINSGDPYFTTLSHLYDMTISLLSSDQRKSGEGTYKTPSGEDKEFKTWVKGEMKNIKWDSTEFTNSFKTLRPDDECIESLYNELVLYWEVLLELIPDLLNDPTTMRDNVYDSYTEGKSKEVQNHALFRPVVQVPFSELVRSLLTRKGVTDSSFTKTKIKNALKPLGNIDWDLFSPPFRGLQFIEKSTAQTHSWTIGGSKGRSSADVKKVQWKLIRYITGTLLVEKEDLDDFKDDTRVYLFPPLSDDEFNDWWKYVEKQKKQATN